MGILELVKNDGEMRRLFGEQELRIIERQLFGVRLSPSERTRLSRDIRPKFKVVSKLANFTGEFSLKKAQEIKFLLKEAKEIILEESLLKVKKIFVFGSYVENNMRLNSDIDVAVEFSQISQKVASRFKLRMVGRLNKKIQISVFNVLPKKIKEEVITKGKVIYEYGKN